MLVLSLNILITSVLILSVTRPLGEFSILVNRQSDQHLTSFFTLFFTPCSHCPWNQDSLRQNLKVGLRETAKWPVFQALSLIWIHSKDNCSIRLHLYRTELLSTNLPLLAEKIITEQNRTAFSVSLMGGINKQLKQEFIMYGPTLP